MIIISLFLILCLILFLLAIIQTLSWLNNIKVKRYYKKVASFLQGPQIIFPSLFSYGRVIGVYKYRKVEWRCFVGFLKPTYYKGSYVIEAKMQLKTLPLHKGSGIRLTENTFIKDNWIVYFKEQPFALKENKVLTILEELRVGAEGYEKGLIVKCFNCGFGIAKDLDRCPKCSWTWKQNE